MANRKKSKIDEKLNYSITIISLCLIILLSFVFWSETTNWSSFNRCNSSSNNISTIPVGDAGDIVASGREYIPSDGVELFSISKRGQDYPQFIKEIMVDPFTTEAGETQCFAVSVVDPGAVEKVLMKIDTDFEIETFDMELIEGTTKEGKWLVCWDVKSVSEVQSYRSYFWAINKKGEKNIVTIVWQTK